MNINIDDETLDGIVRSVLKEQIEMIREGLKKVKKKKKSQMTPTDKEELGEMVMNLDAFETTLKYFGGDIK